MAYRALSLLLLCGPLASAGLLRIEVIERSDVLDGQSQGPAGAYERIIAKAYFAVDPKLPANRIISDIDFAPRNEKGLVEFSADLYVLKPRDSARGNGTALYEVSNRGRKGMLSMFNRGTASSDPRTPEDFGDGFLLRHGFTLVWLGWQFDVPRDPQLVRLYPPIASNNGQPIMGLIRAEWVVDRPSNTNSLADRTHIAYPVLDPMDAALQLNVRDRRDGPRKIIPRKQWQFAREKDGKLAPDSTSVHLAGGFTPGKLYELVYRTKDPALVGLGPTAVRDLISFLKTGRNGITLLGDQRQYIKRALAFGTSQSGRFLRTFLYYGFNQDEKNQRVFDGVWAHVAGAGRGSFNHRFAQPSRDGHPFFNTLYPTDIFPFTDLEQSDPETKMQDGILKRAMAAGVVPKIFYTNGSYEYYGRAAALIHSNIDGKSDATLAADTRAYLLSGTQHGAGAFPPRKGDTQNLANSNDYRFPMRALMARMQDWLKDGKEPPVSQVPLAGKDQLVAAGAVQFPKIPGVAFPQRLQNAFRADYGPQFRSAGIVTIEPPKLGKAFPALVPQVDADGNETSGIRLPQVSVPLATYAGWNLRDPKIGAPEELFSMVGSTIPFARTKAEREQKRDPRPSIEERYPNREAYIARVMAAARELVKDGYLLEEDVSSILGRAGAQWDYFTAATADR